MRNLVWVVTAVALLQATSGWAQNETLSGGATEGTGMNAPGGLYDRGSHTRKNMLSGFVFAPYFGYVGAGFGAGAGVRYAISVLPDGLIQDVNESIEFEGGVDATYYFGFFPVFSLVPEVRWTFYLLPNLAVYPKISLRVNLAIDGIYPAVIGDGALGILFKFSDTMYLRAELGGFGGARVGAGLEF